MTYDAAARPLFQVLSCVDVPTGPGSPIGPRGRQVGGGRSVAAPSRRHKPIFPRLAGRCPGPGNGRHCCRLEVDRPAPGGHSRRSSPKRRLMSMKNLRSVRWIVLVLGLMLVAAACGGGGGGGGSGKPATKQGGTLNYGADQVQSVTGSDNGKTVTVVFKQPFSDWRSLFCSGNFILPAHYVSKQPGGWNTGLDKNPQNIPSAGPFKVQNYTPGQSLTLARNDQYFGKKASLDSIVFRFLPESTTQPAALQNNEVDMIYPQPQLDMVQQVKALPDVTNQINLGPTFEHLDFNFKNQFLSDVAVRKAIATGINVDELVKRTVGQFASQVKPLGNRLWMPFQEPYQDHFGQYAKGGKKISVRFSTTAGNKLRETQGELFQAQMKQVGIDIKIANLDSQKLFGDALPNGNFDIADFAWVGGPFAVSGNRDIYRTGAGSNYGQYANSKVDQMFAQAMAEFDANKAADLLNQIDQIITDDMATIPLYNKPTFLAFRNTFVNVSDNATQDGPFWNSSTWAQKAE